MSDDSNAPSDWREEVPARRRRPFPLPQVVLSVVVLVAVVWSGYWWFATRTIAEHIDKEIARFAAMGVTVTCPDRRIRGYPFRFDLHCGPLAARAADGSEASVPALTMGALAYNPTRMVIELRDPLTASLPDGTGGTLSWELAHASLDFDPAGLTALSTLIEKPNLARGSDTPITAERAALHTRLRPEGKGSDVAFSAENVKLPALADTGSLVVVAMLDDGGRIARGDLPGFLKQLAGGGARGQLAETRLSAGGSELKISGPFSVSADGALSGAFKVSLMDPQKLASVLAQGFGIHLPLPEPSSLSGLLSGLGSPPVNGRPAMTLPIEVRDGQMRMGFVPLGTLPKLFDPDWFAEK